MRLLIVAVLLATYLVLAPCLLAAPAPDGAASARRELSGGRSLSRFAELEAGPRFEKGLNFEGGGSYLQQFRADGDGGATVSVRRMRLSTLLVYKRDDPPPIPLGLAVRHDRYDLGGTGSFSAAWTNVNSAQVSIPVLADLSERWKLAGLAYVGGSAEERASLLDGLSFGVVATFTYKVNERFRIGPGIGVFRQLEEDFAVLPLASMRFDITPTWSVGFGGEGEGAGLAIAYRPNDSFRMSLGGAFDLLRFRRTDGTVGQDSGADLLASVTLRLQEGVRVQLSAGARIFGNLRQEDARGAYVADEDYGPSLLFDMRLEFGGR